MRKPVVGVMGASANDALAATEENRLKALAEGLGGATGTLNEFTIAYDEGKIIGVLEGSGGVADHLREIIGFCNKPTAGSVFYESDAVKLVARCVEAFGS